MNASAASHNARMEGREGTDDMTRWTMSLLMIVIIVMTAVMMVGDIVNDLKRNQGDRQSKKEKETEGGRVFGVRGRED